MTTETTARNPKLLNLIWNLLSKAHRKTYLIDNPELQEFMQAVIRELQAASQLKTEKMKLMERVTYSDDKFRERYFKALIDTVDFYLAEYNTKYPPPRPERIRITRQLGYIKDKLNLFKKYNSENL